MAYPHYGVRSTGREIIDYSDLIPVETLNDFCLGEQVTRSRDKLDFKGSCSFQFFGLVLSFVHTVMA